LLSGDRLVDAVSGFSHPQISARLFSHELDRIVVLPDVNAFHRNLSGDLSMIVRDERNGRSICNILKHCGRIRQFADRSLFSAKLNNIHAAFNHGFSNARHGWIINVT